MSKRKAQPKAGTIVSAKLNQRKKREVRVNAIREWLMTDGGYKGRRYNEEELRALLNLSRNDHWSGAVHHAKVEILRDNSLRSAEDDGPITFEESSYIDIVKARENLTRISADLYFNQSRLATLIEQVEADIERLSTQERVSTELAETKKLLTALIREQATLYRDLEKLERNRMTASQRILEQQRKLAKDKRATAAEDKTPSRIAIDLGSV